MKINQQYTCPKCNRIGAHPIDMKAPLCDKCNYKVIMMPSLNGKIMTDSEYKIYGKKNYE